MANLIKRTWTDGETVDAQKMNTIRDDLETLNQSKLEVDDLEYATPEEIEAIKEAF